MGGTCAFECNPGYDSCGGTGCVSLTEDGNCGFCGHDCLEGKCTLNGLCVPTVYHGNDGAPTDIAVDPGTGNAARVYWTTIEGDVKYIEKMGGSAPTIDATDFDSPLSIAVDDQRVYVGDQGNLEQYPRTGTSPPALKLNAVNAVHIALDDDRVYWVNYGTNEIRSAEKGTNASVIIGAFAPDIQPVSPSPEPDNGLVFYGTSNPNASGNSEVGYTAKTHNGMNTLKQQALPVEQIAIDQSSVYWTTPAMNRVTRMPKSGGSEVTIAQGESGVWAIVADGQGVVWSNDAPTNNIRTLDGSEVRTLATGEPSVCALALDDAYVYWVNCEGGGSVKRVAR